MHNYANIFCFHSIYFNSFCLFFLRFRDRIRQFPALVNCTTIDWFLEWPRDALIEVANKYLLNLDFTTTITGEPMKRIVSLYLKTNCVIC